MRPSFWSSTALSSLILSALVLVSWSPLAAQEPTPDDSIAQAQAQALLASPPPNFASAEISRSRNCVPLVGRLEAVSSELDPRRRRSERVGALHRAVSAEDSLRVTPLAQDDPLERAVGEWFRTDHRLAMEYLESEDEEVREDRQARREAMLERLEQELTEVNQEAEEILASTSDLQRAVRSCQGRIFVRSAVVEACGSVEGSTNPLCEAVQDTAQAAPFQFVESAVDLWEIEQLRPWSEPSRLAPTPTGGLGGARTAALTRRGNLSFAAGLEPLFQIRDSVPAEELEGLEAHLDSLGIEFDHPDFTMVPTMGYELDVPGRLGDETEYLLHFGDLADPARDVLQRIPIPDRWPVVGAFTPSEAALVRLVRGDPLSMTAVRIPEDGGAADAVFTIGLTNVQQSPQVNALLEYMMSGRLGEDLAALVPPEGAEEAEGEQEEEPLPQ